MHSPETLDPARLRADSGVLRRPLAAAGLVGIALIHLIDTPGKFEELPYMGFAFVGLIVSSLLVAEVLVRNDSATGWAGGAVLAVATMLGFVASRTIGLPGAGEDDIGNWSEPLGLASLLVEGVVVWLCLAGYAGARARR